MTDRMVRHGGVVQHLEKERAQRRDCHRRRSGASETAVVVNRTLGYGRGGHSQRSMMVVVSSLEAER